MKPAPAFSSQEGSWTRQRRPPLRGGRSAKPLTRAAGSARWANTAQAWASASALEQLLACWAVVRAESTADDEAPARGQQQQHSSRPLTKCCLLWRWDTSTLHTIAELQADNSRRQDSEFTVRAHETCCHHTLPVEGCARVPDMQGGAQQAQAANASPSSRSSSCSVIVRHHSCKAIDAWAEAAAPAGGHTREADEQPRATSARTDRRRPHLFCALQAATSQHLPFLESWQNPSVFGPSGKIFFACGALNKQG